MGQARRRKSEIDALKANGPKKPMGRFMVRGIINPDGTVSFPRDGLDSQQSAFVNGCEQVINTQNVPQWRKEGIVATSEDSLALVMYNNSNDFCGMLMPGIKVPPDDAWRDYQQVFRGGPAIGRSFTRDELVRVGTEAAGMAFDMLAEGGRWPWPNAHAVLEKRGDRMVVIDTL